MAFLLHPRLDADTLEIARLDLCIVRLMNNALWPWVILSPARDGLTEFHHLAKADRGVAMEEIARVSTALETLFGPDKLNVAAIGNIVPQLHIHVVARRRGDPAWPNPVWGSGLARSYQDGEGERIAKSIADSLKGEVRSPAGP